MERVVVLLEGWNDNHESDCMSYIIETEDDIDNMYSIEAQAVDKAIEEHPKFKNFKVLYTKILLNR